MYVYVYVCVCVCERERERETETLLDVSTPDWKMACGQQLNVSMIVCWDLPIVAYFPDIQGISLPFTKKLLGGQKERKNAQRGNGK